MSPAFASLVFAAIAWVVVHIGVAGTGVREAIVARIGQRAFRGLFVVASFVLLGWLIHAYAAAGPVRQLWIAPRWLVLGLMLLMLPALLLLVCSLSMPNPTSVRGGHALEAPDPASGILRITRHPMLWSFALWAIAHMFPNGDFASLVLFATILITALYGMPSIDRKRAARDPQGWAAFAAKTSILPFGAILSGRNRLVPSEIGLWRVGVALAAWVVLFLLHGPVLGVSAIPF